MCDCVYQVAAGAYLCNVHLKLKTTHSVSILNVIVVLLRFMIGVHYT